VFQKAVRRRTCKLYILGPDIVQDGASHNQMVLARTGSRSCETYKVRRHMAYAAQDPIGVDSDAQ
jgi:hypothetical protein